MGSFFSKCFRKSVLDIETSEGWDQRMQEFQDKRSELADKKKSCQRRLSNLRILTYAMIIPVLFALYLVYLHIHNLTITFLYPFVFFIGILLYILKRRSLKVLAQCNEEDTLVLDDIKKHIDALSNVKACFPDISRLALKYNIDINAFNSKQVESRNHDIKALLHVIRKLIELPLCQDCRYYTGDERQKILDMIPPHYASLFANVEPQKAEASSKPVDEKLMALIDKEENEPMVIQKVLVLEDQSQKAESSSKSVDENDGVQVEEIMDETEESELRKRHVTNTD